MAIPSKQIGQPSSTKAGLLWQISKQLETLTNVAGNVYIPAVSTVDIYSTELSFPINYVSMVLTCDGDNIGNYIYTNDTVNDIDELVLLFNTNSDTSVYGTFSASTSTVLQLTTPNIVKHIYCPEGTLGLNIFND